MMLFPAIVYLERKVSAFMQDRIGPNRASIAGIRLGGIIHPLADVVKLIAKEEFIPSGAHRGYYLLAPFMAMTISLCLMAALPAADVLEVSGRAIPMQVLDFNVGVLYLLAVGSLGVYGIVIAGWASNNKWSFLGALRSSAQMISYEIPMALSLIGLLMVFQTVHLNDLVRMQGGSFLGPIPMWGIFVQPLGFVIFLIAVLAETNRTPFDLPEGESEIVAGFHTEYSSMRFALFYMAEGVNLVVASALIVTLYLGGWQVPGLTTQELKDAAPMLLRPILLALIGIVIVAEVLLFRFHLNNRNRWGDARDREGIVLLGFNALVLMLLVAFTVMVRPDALPAWGPSVFAASLQILFFLAKLLTLVFIFVWVRWTLPRFRYDQLMDLGWKNLIPLSLLNIMITGVVILWLGGD